MKRFAIVLALVLAFAISAGAQDFSKFSAKVPSGWTAEEDGPATVFTKTDGGAQLVITIDEIGDATAAQLADVFVSEFGKNGYTNISKPEADSEGDYSFDMKDPHGKHTHAMLTVKDHIFALILMSGAENASEEMINILNSLDFK